MAGKKNSLILEVNHLKSGWQVILHLESEAQVGAPNLVPKVIGCTDRCLYQENIESNSAEYLGLEAFSEGIGH